MNQYTVSVVLVALCATLCSADHAAEVANQLEANGKLEDFEEDVKGYDQRTDQFFFQDNLVAKSYERSNFKSVKVILAGQNPDVTGTRAEASGIPWIVAQKCVNTMGVSSDRWDAKQNKAGHQFFALYNGIGTSDFVVNKLRSHLLRNIANAVQNYLLVLDSTYVKKDDDSDDDDSDDDDSMEKYVEFVQEQVKAIIRDTMQNIDNNIREVMKDNDKTSASALIVIVTKHYVIVANAGHGRVIGYDSVSTISNLVEGQDPTVDNVFGDTKNKNTPVEPYITISNREFKDEDEDDANLQFLIVETPLVRSLINETTETTILLNNVAKLRDDPRHEQDIYRYSAQAILDQADKNIKWTGRWSKKDLALMIIGLEKNYKLIH